MFSDCSRQFGTITSRRTRNTRRARHVESRELKLNSDTFFIVCFIWLFFTFFLILSCIHSKYCRENEFLQCASLIASITDASSRFSGEVIFSTTFLYKYFLFISARETCDSCAKHRSNISLYWSKCKIFWSSKFVRPSECILHVLEQIPT